MRKWLLLAATIFFGGVLVATEVEARRLGGGRTVGTQRNVTAPPAQTPAQPAQQQAAQGQQQGAAQAAPAGSRWGGILGGLALGGLLGYFLGGGGMMGALMGVLLLVGIAMLAMVAFRAFAARREHAPQQVQFAGMRETVNLPAGNELPMAAAAKVPAGFDSAGFLRAARMNFLKLQAANDAGQLEEIREFTTDELYEELKKDLAGRGAQHTEIGSLQAEMLEFVTEGDNAWASVRFSGTVREAPGAADEAFAEVWNLVRPADGSAGWLLAGIQQMH